MTAIVQMVMKEGLSRHRLLFGFLIRGSESRAGRPALRVSVRWARNGRMEAGEGGVFGSHIF